MFLSFSFQKIRKIQLFVYRSETFAADCISKWLSFLIIQFRRAFVVDLLGLCASLLDRLRQIL